jgi:phosphatidylinositol-3-phosphatase
VTRIIASAVVSALLIVTCGAGAPAAVSSPTPLPAPTATIVAPSSTATVTPSPASSGAHIFLIVMENASLTRALAAPSIAKIAETSAVATNYRAVAHPSLPNYLALTSGTTWGIVDDGFHALPAGGLGTQLTAAGISWRAYMEGLTAAGCQRSPYPYALKHNPFAYYGSQCPDNVVPLDRLDADLQGDTPRFAWITPGLCHDGHDCALSQAGPWLADVVGRITSSSAWRDHGILFVVWDESDGSSANVVALLALSPGLVPHHTDTAYDHYSLLATVEDSFGLPRLGSAASARPLTELLSPRNP